VGISSRSVNGYSLSSKGATPHVWNEIEIRKNVWMPLEPQDVKSIFNAGSYFPLLNSVLENLDAISSRNEAGGDMSGREYVSMLVQIAHDIYGNKNIPPLKLDIKAF
jgi:hypothetical protein